MFENISGYISAILYKKFRSVNVFKPPKRKKGFL